MDSAGNVEPIRPVEAPRIVGKDIRPLTKVKHPEYGTGHITADLGWAVEIYWDEPYTKGLAVHLLPHDRGWVEQLERLD